MTQTKSATLTSTVLGLAFVGRGNCFNSQKALLPLPNLEVRQINQRAGRELLYKRAWSQVTTHREKTLNCASHRMKILRTVSTKLDNGADLSLPEEDSNATIAAESISLHDAAINENVSNHKEDGTEEASRKEKKLEKKRAKRKAVITTAFASAALLTSIYALMVLSGPGSWRYYLAGGICASTSHAITTPIDVLKTRQQVLFQQTQLHQQAETVADTKDKAPSLFEAFASVLKQPDGISQLLAGLGPTSVGYLFEGAAKFGVYEVLKPIVQLVLSAKGGSASSSLHNILVFSICATMSGLVASLMLCPMEAIRIRIVTKDSEEHSDASVDVAETGKKRGWVYDGLRMLRKEGFSGMYKGLGAMIAKQVPYTVTKQVSFDIGATVLYRYIRAILSPSAFVSYSRPILFAIPLLSAALASFLSCISSQPGDMLLSLVNAHAGDKNTRDFAKEIFEEQGIRGFFVGMKARFLHVGLIVTVQLLIYDMVKRMCGIAATGSA